MQETWIQFISVLIAAVSAVISVVFAARARNDARIQQQTQLVALSRQHYMELQRWADAAVDSITEAIFLCDLDTIVAGNENTRLRILSSKQTLSALIDRGRFFLPNEARDQVGQNKPAAYRGFRPPALDCVVDAYDVIASLDASSLPNGTAFGKLWHLRKDFVSQIQVILDPEARAEEQRNLMVSVK